MTLRELAAWTIPLNWIMGPVFSVWISIEAAKTGKARRAFTCMAVYLVIVLAVILIGNAEELLDLFQVC